MTNNNQVPNPWNPQNNEGSWQPSEIKKASNSGNSAATSNSTNSASSANGAAQETQATQPITPVTPVSSAQPNQLNQPNQATRPVNYNQPTQPYGQSARQGYGQNYGQGSASAPRPAPQYGAYATSAGSAQSQSNGSAGSTSSNGATRPNGPTGPTGPTSPNNPVSPAGPMGPMGPNNGSAAAPVNPKKRRSDIWTTIITALITAALVSGFGLYAISSGMVTVTSSSSLSSVNTNSTGSSGSSSSSVSSTSWKKVVKKVASSVVSITVKLSNGYAMGSGAIFDTNGNIVTNNHVIEDAQSIEVTLSNGNIYEAELVGTDATTDIAVIKLKNPPSNLNPVSFADSSSVAVGEEVLAIGNPLGYSNTATSGIVSALNRPVSVTSDDSSTTVVTNAIQIDASINSGNSGGPTFNSDGKLIGINSSIATASSSDGTSSSTGSIGIGFAIPSNLVKTVANEIIDSGSATHVLLGVSVTTGEATADSTTRYGAVVKSVTSGSSADEAGVKEGDTIIGYNGNSVESSSSLLGYVRATTKGSKVTITIIRDGKVVSVTATMNNEES